MTTHFASLDDPRLNPFRDLKSTNSRSWRRFFVAEGEKLVERLLGSHIRVVTILSGERYAERYLPLVDRQIDVLVVPDDLIDGLVGFNFHRGVLACAERPANFDVLAHCQSTTQCQTLVVCPAVHDPENLGAILRISAALGIDGLILGSECCDPFSRRVLRVSMGSALAVPLTVVKHLDELLSSLREQCGVELWAAVAEAGAVAVSQASRPRRLALLLGNEGHGLADRWLELCQNRVTIPIASGVDSLNVSVAAGILLYELTRGGRAVAPPENG